MYQNIKTELYFGPLIDYLKNLAATSSIKSSIEIILERINAAPELSEPIQDVSILVKHKDLVEQMMQMLFPPFVWEKEIISVVVPFHIVPIYSSPKFKKLFLDKTGSFKDTIASRNEEITKFKKISFYLNILRQFYGIDKVLPHDRIIAIKDDQTDLDQYYQLNIDTRFLNAVALKEPKVLTDSEKTLLLENMTVPSVLEQIIQIENFKLQGCIILRAFDVTLSEIVSILTKELIDQESITSQSRFLKLQESLRILFKKPYLIASLAGFFDDKVLMLNSGCGSEVDCIFANSNHIPRSYFEGSLFERAVTQNKIIRLGNISQERLLKTEVFHSDELIEGSMMVVPLNYKNDCVGALVIFSDKNNDFDAIDEMIVKRIQPLFAVAIKRALDDLNSNIQAFIKEKCTAIHPSVEWRFTKAVIEVLNHRENGKMSELETIVFRDVYPLYGVSDVRGSTGERNRSIQKDLSEHLNLALSVIESSNKAYPMIFFNELEGRINEHMNRIQTSISTGDEFSVVKFLTSEVESLFKILKNFGKATDEAIEKYKASIDPRAGTVYNIRKKFEDSIAMLNQTLTTFLDYEAAKAQQIFPHYFERHRTDGVDYLIYIGESMVENKTFHKMYVQNLRLWQIKLACAKAWITEYMKDKLPVPLNTAHLILVQDSPLSIRFRYDEKRFDADGAYDIRHEIIKSRIDKAVIKGTSERLTQPKKIAIVYSHIEEEIEMTNHIKFLIKEGFLTDNVEKLQLEDLPGVQGLQSLRVEVVLDSPKLVDYVKIIHRIVK